MPISSDFIGSLFERPLYTPYPTTTNLFRMGNPVQDCPFILLIMEFFHLMPVSASANRRKAHLLILIELRTCRNAVVNHQEIQSFTTIFLVYC